MSRYRVLPADGPVVRLVDAESGERATVAAEGYDSPLSETVASLRPGYLVDAELDWRDDDPRFDDLTVVARTLFAFRDGVTNLFEEALDVWAEAEREGMGVNSRTTYDTDREPNGALYVVAEQRGERDVFEELRTGALPVDPLLDPVDADEPYEIFVLGPANHPFVAVYIVLEKDGILADTVRDTYDCPRPAES